MERVVYQQMAELDDRHWWYRARRRILAELIRRAGQLPRQAQILEIGCGTGHNFEMLRHFGRLDALEVDDQARALAARRLGREVGDAPLPGLPGVPDGSYDLIALLDVLEHVDDRPQSLASIARKLKPNGRILVTVPAYQWLWSGHDVINHHSRRYTRRSMKQAAEGAGWHQVRTTYFNSLLLPAAILLRVLDRFNKKPTESSLDLWIPPEPLNWVLERPLAIEAATIDRGGRIPAGLSLLSVFR